MIYTHVGRISVTTHIPTMYNNVHVNVFERISVSELDFGLKEVLWTVSNVSQVLWYSSIVLWFIDSFLKTIKKMHTFHNQELGIRYHTTKGCQVPSSAASCRTLVLNPWFEWSLRSLLTVHISSYFFFFHVLLHFLFFLVSIKEGGLNEIKGFFPFKLMQVV
jgi:hypothetical protein